MQKDDQRKSVVAEATDLRVELVRRCRDGCCLGPRNSMHFYLEQRLSRGAGGQGAKGPTSRCLGMGYHARPDPIITGINLRHLINSIKTH